MTNKKSTKRALLMSALSLLLCVSMLVGSTFAWFTDSVTSGKNTIQSGNLDVELYYTYDAAVAADVNSEAWVKVTSTTDVFGYDLWEPGYTKVAYFKVVNEGSLELKYQLAADIYKEKAGKNQAGAEFLLSDHIKTALVNVGATRDQILALEGTPLKDSFNMSKGSLAAKGTAVVGLAIWMPTAVGNVANHDGETIPEITFGINLLAVQKDAESDSFGSDYDEGLNPAISYVSDYAGLKNALAKGGAVELMSDITIPAAEMNTTAASVPVAIAITDGQNVVLDLNGKDIVTEGTGSVATLFVHNSTLTITGEGEINQNADGFIVWAKGNSTVNVEGGTFNGGADETTVFYASSNVAYDPASGYATINVYGGNFDSDSKNNPADRKNIANVQNHGAGKINYYGGTFGWNPTGSDYVHVDDRNHITVAEGYVAVDNGNGTYSVLKGDVAVDSVVDLETALNEGKSVVLTTNMSASDITIPAEADVNIELNGNELSVTGLEAANADVTITGGTLIHEKSNYPAVSVADGGTLTLDDVAVVSENYCNIMTSGGRQAAEFVGIQIFGGTCVLNDCTIEVDIKDLRFANSAIGIGIHGGNLIMNGGSIIVKSVGSTEARFDSQCAIFAGSDTEKTVTLNNVTVDAKDFLCASKGNIVVNTTDATGTWDNKCSATNGTYVINYNYAG